MSVAASARRVQPNAAPQGVGAVSSHTLLKAGARGAEVKQLQRILAGEGFLKGGASGVFNASTERAVRAYQKAKGLLVDGLVGQQTWGAFNGETYPPGTNLLKRSAAATGSRGSSSSSVKGSPAGADSYEPSGPGKRVTAYVNGSPRSINVVAVGNGKYMRSDAAAAWRKMQAAAAKEGIRLSVNSGFRSMSEQQSLYAKYRAGTGALAARPGYSNHQNGIAIDIGGVGGRGTRADAWLRRNASRFGFRNLPAEFWHFDYVG